MDRGEMAMKKKTNKQLLSTTTGALPIRCSLMLYRGRSFFLFFNQSDFLSLCRGYSQHIQSPAYKAFDLSRELKVSDFLSV